MAAVKLTRFDEKNSATFRIFKNAGGGSSRFPTGH
jgi:hypothetical protein